MNVTTLMSSPARQDVGSKSLAAIPSQTIERIEGNGYFFSKRYELGSSETYELLLRPDAVYCHDFGFEIRSVARLNVDLVQGTSSEANEEISDLIFNYNLNSSNSSGMRVYETSVGQSSESSSDDESASSSTESSSTESSSQTDTSESSSTESSSSTETSSESSSSGYDDYDSSQDTLWSNQTGTFVTSHSGLVLKPESPVKLKLTSGSASNISSIFCWWSESTDTAYSG